MEKIKTVDFNLHDEEEFIVLEITNNISLGDLKDKLWDYNYQACFNLLEYLVLEDNLLRRNQTIIIAKNYRILEQFAKDRFTYFNVDGQEFLINKIEDTFFYEDQKLTYSSRERMEENLAEVVKQIEEMFSFLMRIHNNKKYDMMIDYLYIIMQIVNRNRIHMVTSNDELSLVIPNFYKISTEWMKMDIILKKTGEIIGNIEFNFKDNSQDYYDYKGNVSYDIKEQYQGCGYGTKALALLRSYLLNQELDKPLYVSTKVENVISQKVAIKNGGILCYEGEVPKSSPLRFLGKVKEVKIYRLENM